MSMVGTKSIRAGAMRHKVTITPVPTQLTAEKSVIENPGSTSTRRCAIEALTGRELANAREVHGEVSHKVTMRYAELNPDDRLTWTDPYHSNQTRTLNILWIDTMPALTGRYVVAYCRETIAA